MKTRSLLFAAALMLAASAAFAFGADLAPALHGLTASISPGDAGPLLLAGAAAVPMKFQVRDGFVATTYTKADLGNGRYETRENNFYGGEIVMFDDGQAIANLHKLEPQDDAASAFAAARFTKVDVISPPAGVQEQVAAAVAEAIAAFTAGLVAAGVLPGAEPPAAPDKGAKGVKA